MKRKEKIQSMSEEELAKFLFNFEMDPPDYSLTFCDLCNGQYDCTTDCITIWLRREWEE